MTATRKLTRAPKVRPDLRMLGVEKLLPTEDNRRRKISKSSVESLARSIARDGVIQPIVVRAHPEKEGFYEIRAGERRWQAAKLAGEKFMPAIVRKLDDQSALSVTIAENLQRENLHPLEEAETIQQAFDRGYDLKSLAARTGKTLKAIARLASLTRLSQVWKDEILKAGSEASRLSVRHLEIIARLPVETQDLLADGSFNRVFARGFPTVEELGRLIDGGLRMLAAIPWKADDETLVPEAGSCLNCPKRSSKHPLLFDTEEAAGNGKVPKGDRCLDPACFARKEVAHIASCECQAKVKHPGLKLVQIGYNGTSGPMQEAFGDRIIRLYNPKVVTAGAKGAVPVMQVDGPKAGAVVYIAPPKETIDSNGHARKVRPKDASGKPVPLPLAERKARLQKRRDAFLVGRVLESLQRLKPDAIAETVNALRNTRSDPAARYFDPLALLRAFGTPSRADHFHDTDPWARYAELRKLSEEERAAGVLQDMAQVWSRRLGGSDPHAVTAQAADARHIGEILGIDLDAVGVAAELAIPTPKSWSSLSDSASAETEECPFEPTSTMPTPKTEPATSTATSKPRIRRRRRS